MDGHAREGENDVVDRGGRKGCANSVACPALGLRASNVRGTCTKSLRLIPLSFSVPCRSLCRAAQRFLCFKPREPPWNYLQRRLFGIATRVKQYACTVS